MCDIAAICVTIDIASRQHLRPSVLRTVLLSSLSSSQIHVRLAVWQEVWQPALQFEPDIEPQNSQAQALQMAKVRDKPPDFWADCQSPLQVAKIE